MKFKFLFSAFFLIVGLSGAQAQSVPQITACTANYQLACDEEKRLTQQVKDLQCRLDAVRKDKQTLIACVAAESNRTELDKLKVVLLQTLNEVDRIQKQPLKLPIPCTTGDCN